MNGIQGRKKDQRKRKAVTTTLLEKAKRTKNNWNISQLPGRRRKKGK